MRVRLMTPTITPQLEELELINYSLLPGEIIVFIEGSESWTDILNNPNTSSPSEPVCFQVKLEDWRKVWFDVQWPSNYPEGPFEISVKGEDITRIEQECWQTLIRNKRTEIGDTEYVLLFKSVSSLRDRYPTYQLISLHLLPLMHVEKEESEKQNFAQPTIQKESDTRWHALLTSHHLISPNKRRSLQQWSSSLRITGFAKVGYPGIIYAEGTKEDVEEFVGNVKGMQWLALRVRFVEVLSLYSGKGLQGWTEYSKIGEVVEEMRKIGRESYILEVGIGSASAS